MDCQGVQGKARRKATGPQRGGALLSSPTEFEEYTYIISGKKQFIIEGETVILDAGQSIKIEKNTRVQYSNPFDESCEYIAICTPAFDFMKVHREEE